jgi:hypothetical protein
MNCRCVKSSSYLKHFQKHMQPLVDTSRNFVITLIFWRLNTSDRHYIAARLLLFKVVHP